MLITRKSEYSGIVRQLDIPVTHEQMIKWNSGMPMQSAMPHLSLAQREYIISGITEDELDELFEWEQILDERDDY